MYLNVTWASRSHQIKALIPRGKLSCEETKKKNKRWWWRFFYLLQCFVGKRPFDSPLHQLSGKSWFWKRYWPTCTTNAYQNHPGTNVFHCLIKMQIKMNEIMIIKTYFEENLFIYHSCYVKMERLMHVIFQVVL